MRTVSSSIYRRKKQKGLTILELMVVAGILVVAITGLLAVFISASLLSQSSSNRAVAACDAQHVLEQIKNLSYADIDGYTDSTFTNLANETVTVTVTTASGIKTITANVIWTERQAQKSFALTTKASR